MALVGTVKSLCSQRVLRACGLILAAGLSLSARFASAQSILLGPAPRLMKSRPQFDPALPTGAVRASQLALDEPGLGRLCSKNRPLCVAWATEEAPLPTAEALSALELAYDRFVLAMNLPAPRYSDDSQPLTWRLGAGFEPLKIFLKPNLSAGFDTAAVVCHSGAQKDLLRLAHLCVGEAIAARLDPAETPEIRRAYALNLWWTVGDITDEDATSLAQVQSSPQAAILTRDSLVEAPAAALFFDYLDHRFGNGSTAALPTGVLSLSAQHTPIDSWRFLNQPDAADVLRATFNENISVWAHRILDFAFARALLPDHESSLTALRAIDELNSPRVDWTIKASTLPRRVAPALPLQPWGSLYVRVDLDVPTDNLELGIVSEWEDPVSMIWQIAKLDDMGRETGRVEIALEQRGHAIERRLLALGKTRSLLIVGTNLGGIDLAHPFDPDHEPFEPHGCTVYVGRL